MACDRIFSRLIIGGDPQPDGSRCRLHSDAGGRSLCGKDSLGMVCRASLARVSRLASGEVVSWEFSETHDCLQRLERRTVSALQMSITGASRLLLAAPFPACQTW